MRLLLFFHVATITSLALLTTLSLAPKREAIAAGDGYVLVKLVDQNDVAPGTGGATFATFSTPGPDLNAGGDVVFSARYIIDGFNKWGVFVRSQEGLTAVALQDQAAPPPY